MRFSLPFEFGTLLSVAHDDKVRRLLKPLRRQVSEGFQQVAATLSTLKLGRKQDHWTRRIEIQFFLELSAAELSLNAPPLKVVVIDGVRHEKHRKIWTEIMF